MLCEKEAYLATNNPSLKIFHYEGIQDAPALSSQIFSIKITLIKYTSNTFSKALWVENYEHDGNF